MCLGNILTTRKQSKEKYKPQILFVESKARMSMLKQPPEVFCKKSFSKKFRNIHWKTPVLESLFNTKRLQHRCLPVNIAKFLRTSGIPKNICKRLFLSMPKFGRFFREFSNMEIKSSASSLSLSLPNKLAQITR